MNKEFIRLNINDNYLTLGNLFRIIKEESYNSNSFLQSDLFSIIFNTSDIADSTVNNYCTGFRAINSKYKNYIKELKSKFEQDKTILLSPIGRILELIEDTPINISQISISEINTNLKLKNICYRLYTISKNDSDVDMKLSNNLRQYIEKSDLYSFFGTILFYVVLERKQPIFIEKKLNDVIEKNIYDTNISVNDIEKFINIHLNSGIWSIRGIMQLANNNNPFACFEIASMECYGIISGKPRYEVAYKYYKIAAQNNHPVANWAIGYLYYEGHIGNRTKRDLFLAFKYFNKARKLNCSNAFNSIGLIFLKGDIPHISKNKKKAIEMFNIATSMGNVYAYNNLGKIYEDSKDYEKAFEYYIISANLGESWAANKIGEFHRTGVIHKKNLKEAFKYYLISSESSKFTLCKWSKYNLAKYFYENGCIEININKDINKAIELLEDISDNFLIATQELFYIYYHLYINDRSNLEYLKKVNYYKAKCEACSDYNNKKKQEIELKLKEIIHNVLPISLP